MESESDRADSRIFLGGLRLVTISKNEAQGSDEENVYNADLPNSKAP
ncbi:hypothetical protein H920_00501 [Fukomys damarensis]|uniref:Uncharacterized protein n=1 Tax=Fukomys damarensis TaxID=885580 RepID=A0A091EQU4_FUKDA|nr:hypothetical protein H920_00501 [Fukomys damarensis]